VNRKVLSHYRTPIAGTPVLVIIITWGLLCISASVWCTNLLCASILFITLLDSPQYADVIAFLYVFSLMAAASVVFVNIVYLVIINYYYRSYSRLKLLSYVTLVLTLSVGAAFLIIYSVV